LAGSCEHGNEPSGSIKGGVLLDYLSDSRLLKDSTTWNWLVGWLVGWLVTDQYTGDEKCIQNMLKNLKEETTRKT